MATKAKKEALAGVKKKAQLKSATLVHFSFHGEEEIVSASVQQDVTILSESTRTGCDVRTPLDELPSDVQQHLKAAFKGIAKFLSAASAQ